MIATYYLLVCFNEVHSDSQFSGVSTNIVISCLSHEEITIFWILNDSLYGLLHVPNEFEVCSKGSEGNGGSNEGHCNLHSLRIPVVHSEMDGYTFQCVGIDYNTDTHHLGTQTVLSVITLTRSEVESFNSKLITSWY